MTTHYIDITLQADPEISAAHLLGALFDHLHMALVDSKENRVGISFPAYSLSPRTLGDTLRLHGPESALAELKTGHWLKGMRDHARIGTLAAAPADAPHRTVQRKQFKTNVDRLRRRRMRRKGETMQQATQAIPSSIERKPNLPYLHARSRSTAQPFCLFINMGSPTTRPTPGTFNSHGLSTTTTIPWF